MKTKITAVALILVTAGVFAYTRPHNALPSDLRDAVADNGKFDTSIPILDKNSANLPEPKAGKVGRDGQIKLYEAEIGKLKASRKNEPDAAKRDQATKEIEEYNNRIIELAWDGVAHKAGGKMSAPASKIVVTPVTEHMNDAILVKFRKGVDLVSITHILAQEGLASVKSFDNGDGYYVRISIKDGDAAGKVIPLSYYSAVESVQVNERVFGLISGLETKTLSSKFAIGKPFTPEDGGPLFAGTREKGAVAGGKDPYDELKAMFETGTQPTEADLTGVFEGISLVKVYGAPLMDRAEFVAKRKLHINLNNGSDEMVLQIGENNSVVDYCDFGRIAVAPVKFDGGAASAEVRGDTVIAKMNSGYIITRTLSKEFSSPTVYYSYFFKPVKCR